MDTLEPGASDHDRHLWDCLRHAGENMRGVELYLKAGANVNCRNDRRESPLIIASQARSLPLIDLLLRHGAKVNLRDVDRQSALDRVYSLLPLQVFFDSGMSAKARELAPPLLRAGATLTSGLKSKLRTVFINDFDAPFANVMCEVGYESFLRDTARRWEGTEALAAYLSSLDAYRAAKRQLELPPTRAPAAG